MPRTVTLRLKDEVYNLFIRLADQENRPLSNFIETAALRFIQETEFVDEFEMVEIKGNRRLNKSINAGIRDAQAKKGKFIE